MSRVPEQPSANRFDLYRLGEQIRAGLNLPIQAGFVALALLIAVSSWVSLHQTSVLNTSQTWVAHSQMVLAQLRDLHATVLEAQAGARGFVITRESTYAEQYERARSNLGGSVDALERMVEDNAAQHESLAELRVRVSDVSTRLARIVEAARVEGSDAAAELVRAREGQDKMDALRASLKAVEAIEQGLLSKRVELSHDSYVTARWTGVGVGLTAMILLGAVYQLVRRYDLLRELSARSAADSEKRFRTTLSSIGDAVLVVDAQRRLTFVNGATPAVTGITPSMLGRDVEEVFTCVIESTGKPRENPAARALREPGVVRTGPDTALLLSDGTLRPIEATAAGIRGQGGSELGAVLVVRDMTAARQIERERQRITDRFRSLVLATSQIVWTADARGHVIDDSPTWRGFTGQTYEQWHGEGWLDAVHPDDRERVRRDWHAALSSGRPFEMEYRLMTRSGSYRWSRSRAVPVENAGGLVREWVGMNRDIQARKEAEEAQRDASRRKDEFIAMLAHELRNPLAPLRNGLQLLRGSGTPERERALDMPERERALDMPERERALDMMDRQLDHMVRLIDDLLDVSRISQGRLELRTERLDARRVLEQAAETAQSAIQAKRQTLSLSLPDEPLWVDADPVRLAQVITNLLSNASKYSGAQARIWLSAEREGARVLVTVRDTGKGIAPELMPRIWDLFHQGHGSAEKSEGGLGIGLTLVRRLVGMHGGVVEAFSDGVDCGSEFVVRLPAVAAPALPSPRAAPARAGLPHSEVASSSPPMRVLVIDDNEDSAESLAMLLRIGRHDVRVLYRGEDGVAEVARFQPALVLCDIRMPGVSGYEVARRLRESLGSGGALLVALTGYGAAADRELSTAAGFDRHLVKPVEPELLQQMLALAAARARGVESALGESRGAPGGS